MIRTTTALPSAGTAQTGGPLDLADGVALGLGYAAVTAGPTLSTILDLFSVNMQATFRWVAIPNGEFVIPNTNYAGCGIQCVNQSTAYNFTTMLFWEE